MGEELSSVNTRELNCPCGENATYMCECGCPCCGEDPCAFGCGGRVVLLSEAESKWPNLEVRYPEF